MSEPREPYGDTPGILAEIEAIWLRFNALQLTREDPHVHPNAHILHARMCFIAGATGMVFRMRERWLTTGEDVLKTFADAAQDLQPELLGLMAAFRAGGDGKAKGGSGDG